MAVLLKASLVVIILLAFYKLFLEKESFFTANRFYLLGCLVLAAVLPFISLPQLVEHQGIVAEAFEVAPEETSASLPAEALPIQPVAAEEKIVASEKREETGPIPLVRTPLEKQTQTLVTRPVSISAKALSYWLMWLYIFGVGVFSVHLLAQITSMLWKIYTHTDQIPDEDHTIVNVHAEIDPCSFFRYIFINPASYDYETYEQILAHEKVHVRQRHSFDLLLAECAVILLWFNPFIWILRKEVEKNIEYQTDDILVKGKTEEKEQYQLNLLKVATYTQPLSITTNYNQSLIKQRILKMNTKRSNIYSYWKYAFVAPLLLLLVLLLNKPNTLVAQNRVAEWSVPEHEPQAEIQDKNEVVSTPLAATESAPEAATEKEAVVENADCKALLAAIRAQDINQVKALIKTADVNCTDPDPGYQTIKKDNLGRSMKRWKARTPIVAAARVGNLAIAKLLIGAGADIKQYADHDSAPLSEAAAGGFIDFVTFLVQKGVDVNELSHGHESALHSAAANGHLETATYLLQQGADINVNTQGQGTPLNAAARNGHDEVAKLLLDKGAAINLQTNGQGSALNAAARNGHNTTVELLLAAGADIDAQTNGQGSALNAAARHGHHEVIKLLLAAGVNIDAQTNGQGSALNAAARHGQHEVIKLLLAAGADIDAQTNGQGSALNAAARHGNHEVIKLLLAAGADIDTQTNGQGSALNAAARHGHVETVSLLLAKGADANVQNNGQGSALNAAARHGHLEVIKLLLAAGADIDAQTNGQGSALNAAARHGHVETVSLLLAKGADANAQNNGQGSALNAAARHGQLAIVKILVENGADVNARTNGQGSAVEAASRHKHKDVVKYLKAAGAM